MLNLANIIGTCVWLASKQRRHTLIQAWAQPLFLYLTDIFSRSTGNISRFYVKPISDTWIKKLKKKVIFLFRNPRSFLLLRFYVRSILSKLIVQKMAWHVITEFYPYHFWQKFREINVFVATFSNTVMEMRTEILDIFTQNSTLFLSKQRFYKWRNKWSGDFTEFFMIHRVL